MLNKTTTYSPKEALDADPDWKTPIKLGRGRMPTGGDAHCRALAAQGYRIKGYQVEPTNEVSTSTPDAPVAPKVVKVKAVGQEIANFVILWEEKEWKALDENNKEHTMRWVCNNCRVSLVQCHCGSPEIIGGVKVRIVPR